MLQTLASVLAILFSTQTLDFKVAQLSGLFSPTPLVGHPRVGNLAEWIDSVQDNIENKINDAKNDLDDKFSFLHPDN